MPIAFSSSSGPSRRARPLFLVMTAVEHPGVVDQLVRALAPFPVVIHHDFGAREEHGFRPARHLSFAPGPGRGGWGAWSYVEALRESLRYCLSREDVDYFQLLSGSCLPIRPVAAFAQYLADSEADVHADWFDVREEEDATLGYAYRMLADRDTVTFRALRRMALLRFGKEQVRRPVCGLEVPIAQHAGWLQLAEPVLGAALDRQLRLGGERSLHLRPVIGSNWLGMRRRAAEHLVECLSDPAIVAHFHQRFIPEEHAIPAVLAAGDFRREPSNHLINRFDDRGHPLRFDVGDLLRLRACGRWFARKFPDDPASAVRRQVLRQLGVPASTGSAASVPSARYWRARAEAGRVN